MSGFQEFPPAAVEQTLAARFATIVARHPGSVAVAGRDLSLTYAELDGASSALAGELLDRGGDGQQPFALLLDQGPAFALAFLAAVKAGAIVVPLDPMHPPERLRWIVREAGCDALVCSTPHESLARTLVAGGDRVVVLGPIGSTRLLWGRRLRRRRRRRSPSTTRPARPARRRASSTRTGRSSTTSCATRTSFASRRTTG
jgi:acyl-CoA synthetase (AMP-forming)/AMP-acid ligase II